MQLQRVGPLRSIRRETREIREYLSVEQRREAGCRVRRMQSDFCHGLLAHSARQMQWLGDGDVLTRAAHHATTRRERQQIDLLARTRTRRLHVLDRPNLGLALE